MARRRTQKLKRRSKSKLSRKQRGGAGKTLREPYGSKGKPLEYRKPFKNSGNPRYNIRDHPDLEKWRDLAFTKTGDAEELIEKLDAWLEKRFRGFPVEWEMELDTYTKEGDRLIQEMKSLVEEYNLVLDDLLTEHKERRKPTIYNRLVTGTEAFLECFGPTCAKWARQHTPLDGDKPTLLILNDLIKKIDSKLYTAHRYQDSDNK